MLQSAVHVAVVGRNVHVDYKGWVSCKAFRCYKDTCEFHRITVNPEQAAQHDVTVAFAYKTFFENQILYEISTVDNRGQLITNLNKQLKVAYEKAGLAVTQLDAELQNKINAIKRPGGTASKK